MIIGAVFGSAFWRGVGRFFLSHQPKAIPGNTKMKTGTDMDGPIQWSGMHCKGTYITHITRGFILFLSERGVTVNGSPMRGWPQKEQGKSSWMASLARGWLFEQSQIMNNSTEAVLLFFLQNSIMYVWGLAR